MNEFDLIRDVFQQQAAASLDNSSILCGIGDDAAVISPQKNKKLVTCTDTLISGRHFPENTSAYSVGYKAVAVNLSDLAAMGAAPHSILLALSLPQHTKENHEWLTEFANGLFACCHEFNVQLIGGDTTKSDELIITVTAFGFAEQCVYRSDASVGDVIAVTATIGDAAFALQDILEGKPNKLQNRLDQPTPRVQMGKQLSSIATSMIDISDGLLQDLGHICAASGVGAKLNLDNLPTHPLLQALPFDTRMAHQLSGGDDYELLFTFPKNTPLPQTDVPITVIGEIIEPSIEEQPIEESDVSLYHQGIPYSFNQSGYQHF